MKKISILLFTSLIIVAFGCKNTTKESPIINSEIVKNDTLQSKSDTGQTILSKKIGDYTESNTEGEVVTPKSIPKKWMIVPGTRVGEIRKNSSLKSLEATYGKENILIEGTVTLGRSPEGNLIKGIKTKIFRGKDNEVEIVWSDTANIKNPVVVRILGTEQGDWITNTNVKIGTPLDYLIVLNTKDFYFLGFDEETYQGKYNGIVTWDKGRLPNTFGLHLVPSLMSKTLPVFENFLTLAKFPTNHPDVPSLGLSVGQMSFTFN